MVGRVGHSLGEHRMKEILAFLPAVLASRLLSDAREEPRVPDGSLQNIQSRRERFVMSVSSVRMQLSREVVPVGLMERRRLGRTDGSRTASGAMVSHPPSGRHGSASLSR